MENDLNKSRLLTSTEELRTTLQTRSLYSPNNQYPLDNASSITKIVNSIDSVVSTLMPYSSFDLSNTVIGRLISTKTPIVEIGLAMLGKQLAYNFQANASLMVLKEIPKISVMNLFDGNKDTKFVTKKFNYSITKKESPSSFINFVNDLTGSYSVKESPFSKSSTLDDYIANTGSGQINLLYKNLNKNIYINDKLFQNAKDENTKTQLAKHNQYNFSDKYFNRYPSFQTNSAIEASINTGLEAVNNERDKNVSHEYGEKIEYFGDTIKTIPDNEGINPWINTDDGFNKNTSIVWGDDNTSKGYLGDFGVQTGLLDYTKNLMNVANGDIININRKIFVDNKGKSMFNGSGVYESSSDSIIGVSSGLRQHTMLDQYDRYAKAIRYNGNVKYNGNPNSTIYKTVMPKIHPINDDDGSVNNKNLMFSLENLAYKVIPESGLCEDGSWIPKSEIGSYPYYGRLMWFPPYDIQFNETTASKFVSTQMLGRNEPIYSYTGSERSGTLTFTLLVDYPQQLNDKKFRGADKHKAIAEFFAFGMNDTNPDSVIQKDYQAKINELQLEIDSFKLPIQYPPEISSTDTISMSFMNNYPNTGNVQSVFQDMYTKGYEVFQGMNTADENGSDGLNTGIYDVSGIVPNYESGGFMNTKLYDNMYSFTGSCALNTFLINNFSNVENRKYYSINLVGTTTALYLAKEGLIYNKALSQRRVDAAKAFIDARMLALFGTDAKVTYKLNAKGIVDDLYNTPATINELGAKLERQVVVTLIKNAITEPRKTRTLNSDEKRRLAILQADLDRYVLLQNKKSTADDKYSKVYTERKPVENRTDGKISTGSKTISDNYYSPCFHSQTPEDFHRRLTFLQQCMRQGEPQHTQSGNDIRNSIFGRQPILILRLGDFINSKIIPENLTIDYNDMPWDMNPEGMGMQYLMCKVTLQIKIIGGQSLKGPIDVLQNALSMNYYANSTFTDKDIYIKPSQVEHDQYSIKPMASKNGQLVASSKINTPLDNKLK
jgi:hypothetical protein